MLLGTRTSILQGDGTDALDPADDSFGHDLFGIAPDISGQGNDPVTDGDPDILRVHARRVFEFVLDVLA
jgi:hypothetical protein